MLAMRLLFGSLAAAVVTFTRVPIPWQLESKDFKHASWQLPLLGGLLALLQGGLLLALPWTPGSLLLAALLLSLPIVLSGGLHEDGLADFCDGILGGSQPAKRFEIMKDPRIGCYGALGLCMTGGLSVLALQATDPSAWFRALLLSQVIARGLAITLTARLDYHQQTTSRAHAYLPARTWSWGHGYALGLSLITLLLLVPPGLMLVLLILGGLVWHQLWTSAIRHLLGAYTGDVLGAMVKLGELLLLLAASLIWPAL
jgi:adenosylcobinamide-GDP ribazoletransferase